MDQWGTYYCVWWTVYRLAYSISIYIFKQLAWLMHPVMDEQTSSLAFCLAPSLTAGA